MPNIFGQWPYIGIARLADEGRAIACEGDADGELVTFTLEATPDGGTWLRLVHDRVMEPMQVPIPANANVAMLRAA